MNIENLHSAKEAADRLGISVSALHRLCNRGTLPSLWIGSQRFVKRDALRELMSNAAYRKASRASDKVRTASMFEEEEVNG